MTEDKKKTETKISRRSLLKGIAAGAVVGAVGGGALLAQKGAIATGPTAPSALAGTTADSVIGESSYDVVVVGAGWAGLCAANRLADFPSLKVALVESMPKGWWAPGGSVILAGQSVHIQGLSLMTDPAGLMKQMVTDSANRARTEMITAMATNASRAITWLEGCGVKFVEPAGKELTLAPAKNSLVNNTQWGLIKPGAQYDAANTGGKVNSMVLYNRLLSKGGQVLFGSPAVKLLQDATGAISGLIVKNQQGFYKIDAKAVILCSGGYTSNQELMARYHSPHAAEIIPYRSPGSTGLGLEMALEIGAGTYRDGVGGLGLRACPEDAVWNPDHVYNNLATMANLGIMVDEYGNRFCDESVYAEEKVGLCSLVNHSDSITGMMVVDSAIYQTSTTVQQLIARVQQFKGTVYKESTIDAIVSDALADTNLGTRLGRQENLVSTVKAYNAAIAAKTNMDLRPARQAALNPLTTPPFYGVPFTLVSILCYGGLLCNEHAEVLDKHGTVYQSIIAPPSQSPIPGLYAAGEIMINNQGAGPTNQVGHENIPSGALATCLIFGIIAAESAVDYVQGVPHSTTTTTT